MCLCTYLINKAGNGADKLSRLSARTNADASPVQKHRPNAYKSQCVQILYTNIENEKTTIKTTHTQIMVIQRWQTVFLFIAFGCMLAFTICSLGQWQLTDYTLNFHTWGISSEGELTGSAKPFFQGTAYLTCISALAALLSLIDIFLYRNLPQQKRVCAVALLMTIATACQAAYLGYTAIEGAAVSWSSLAFAPFIAAAAQILAWRGINSDHKKIRNADRLWS